jgi:hypothetical protein
MRATIIISLVLAGCSFPTKPGDPFACNGDPLPVTAPDIINVHASTLDPILHKAVPATIIETIDGISASGATDSNGEYDTQLTTLGVPHNASIESDPMDSGLYANTIEYPALPISSDQSFEIFQFQKTEFKDPISGTVIDPNSIMIVAVVDCNDIPVGGAMVSVTTKTTPPTVIPVFYITGNFSNLDPTVKMTDPGLGIAVAIGVPTTPPTPLTIDATLSGVTFQSHDITPNGNALTLVEISP